MILKKLFQNTAFIALLIALIYSKAVSGQIKILSKKTLGDFNVNFTAINFPELAQNGAGTSIYADSKNFLWIKEGVYILRYDGAKYTIIDTLDFYSKNFHIQFGEDKSGNIWYPNHNKEKIELRVYNHLIGKTSSAREYTKRELPPLEQQGFQLHSSNGEIYCIQNGKRNIWRYLDGWQLYYQESESGEKEISTRILPSINNYSYTIDKQEISLVDSENKLIASYSILDEENYTLHYSQNIFYILNKKTGNIIDTLLPLNSRKEVAKATPDENKPQKSTFNSLLYTKRKQEGWFMAADYNTGHVILHTTDSTFALNLHKESKKLWNVNSSIENYIGPKDAFYISAQDVLFIHSKTVGLIKIEVFPKNFETLFKGQSIRSMLWINNNELVIIETGFPNFFRYDLKNKSHTQSPEEKINNASITDSLFFSDDLYGNVTKASLLNGTLNEKNRFSPLKKTWEYKDRAGRKWLTTLTGLYLVDSAKFYLKTIDDKELRIEHIYEEENGIFWLSTYQGLVKWKPFSDDITVFNKKNGLLSNEIHATYPDTLNKLWLSTNNGISCLDLTHNTVYNYTTIDGLPDNEQNYLAHSQGPDGRLYFGGVQGIVAFNPNTIQNRSVELPDLFITEIRSLHKNNTIVRQSIETNNFEKTYLFESQSLQQQISISLPFYSSDKLVVAWRRNDTNAQWESINLENNYLELSIPYGKTDIEFKVFQLKNPANYRLYNITLYKNYPLYLSWPFWLGMIVLLGFVVGAGIKYRTIQLKRLNEELNNAVQNQTTQLKEQYEKILLQKTRLEQIDETKNQLFNNINHEFRTPLSIIRVQAEIAQEKCSDKPLLTEGMQNIVTKTEELTGMLDEIMDLSKMKLGSLNNNPAPVFILEFLERTFAQFYGIAEKKLLNYHLDAVMDKTLVLYCDIHKLERILVNLLGNALKFTPDEGSVSMLSEYRNGSLLITVNDSGPGIKADEQERIFERYQQGHASLSKNTGGFGIGLALSREYALLMGGSLGVESDGSKGSKFILEIPARSVEENKDTLPLKNNKANKPKSTAIKSKNTIKKHHLLIAEDNPTMLAYLEEILGETYIISTAKNGEEAWNSLKTNNTIDLVVSDVMMPLMDGFSLLQKIRDTPHLAHKPFVILSALASDDDRLIGLRFGVDAYLTKPFSTHELRAQIGHLLRQQDARLAFFEELSVEEKEQLEYITPNDELNDFDKTWLTKLEHIIFENLHKPELKVPDIALLIGSSERSLFDKLKAITGLTPSEYLKKARLMKARDFLKAKKFNTIKETVLAVGLLDARSFSAAFKTEFGRSPKEFLADLEEK